MLSTTPQLELNFSPPCNKAPHVGQVVNTCWLETRVRGRFWVDRDDCVRAYVRRSWMNPITK